MKLKMNLKSSVKDCPDEFQAIQLLFSNYTATDCELFSAIHKKDNYFNSACRKSVIDLMNMNDETEEEQKNRILQAVFLASLINKNEVAVKAFSEICNKTGLVIEIEAGTGFESGLTNLENNIKYTCNNWSTIFDFRKSNPNNIKTTIPEILSTPTLPNLNVKIHILLKLHLKIKENKSRQKMKYLKTFLVTAHFTKQLKDTQN